MKRCSKCERDLPETEFHVDKGHADGRVSRCKACRAEWVATRKLAVASYNAEYYERNREKRIAEIHDYQRQHPDVKLHSRHRYRARKHQAPGSHTKAELVAIYERQRGCCYYCQTPIAVMQQGDFDHLIPLTRGGSDDAANIVFACPRCNRRKHTRTADEFVAFAGLPLSAKEYSSPQEDGSAEDSLAGMPPAQPK